MLDLTQDSQFLKFESFYGVDSTQFMVGVGGSVIVFQAIENPDDGYRSYLDCVRIAKPDGIFFDRPLAKVIINDIDEFNEYRRTFEGYHLKDLTDDHVWLRFGTDNHDDYYPTFIFEYCPKEPVNT